MDGLGTVEVLDLVISGIRSLLFDVTRSGRKGYA
jgi:hypothetical protein